jgi:hypothetical protein
MGNFWNWFVGVSSENLEQLWKLLVIETVFELVPIALIGLIPSRSEVLMVQKALV